LQFLVRESGELTQDEYELWARDLLKVSQDLINLPVAFIQCIFDLLLI
jgi:hypothetical protein